MNRRLAITDDDKNRILRGIDVWVTAALGLLLLALSALRILGDATSAALGGHVINAALAQPLIETQLGHNLFFFVAALVAVHIAFAFLCLGLAMLSRLAWPASPHSTRTWLLLWFSLASVWLLVANATYFPWSSLGSVHRDIVAADVLGIRLLHVMTIALGLAFLWLVACLLRRSSKARWTFATLSLGLLAGIASPNLIDRSGTRSEPSSQPHVILIGLDSIRADVVDNATQAPAIHSYVESALLFADTTTPLARTFPSWVSLITGRHPHTTGAIINLLPRDMIRTGPTLPEILASNGYRTVYAIDETRFSNLDTTYGFDQMIAPPIGASDFLIGFFGDTPLSNILANTRLGRFLFPYIHGNRAIAHAYDPDTFIERLDRELTFEEPTFLATHLTLAHWPYYWADAGEQPPTSGQSAPKRYYEAALRRLDRQFQDLMDLLERRGALDNAVVIVLSDHGESLGHVSPQQTSGPATEFDESRMVGHGVSVFAPAQYRVLLAMRSYGTNSLIPERTDRVLRAPASLEDVTPTLLELLGVDTDAQFDGLSLAPLISGSVPEPAWADRIRFTETEFNPAGISPGTIMTASAIQNAATYYRVDPVTDRVMVKRELLDEVMRSRQYAALRHDKLLAIVPGKPEGEASLVLFADAGSPPEAIGDPAQHPDRSVRDLWAALQDRFGPLEEGQRAGTGDPGSSDQEARPDM